MQTKNIELILDRQKLNNVINVKGILQGNQNITFSIKLADNGHLENIIDTDTIEIFLYYVNLKKLTKLSNTSISITDNAILITNDINLVNVAGDVSLQIKHNDIYTYSCQYTVDSNWSYTMLPVDGVTDALITDIITQLQAENVFATKDLSNSDGVVSANEGQMFAKIDGKLAPVPLNYDSENNMFVSDIDIQIPPNTLMIGTNTSLHENGGFLEYETKSLGKKYLLVSYENDPIIGSEKPIIWEREALETNVILNSDDGQEMLNVTEINLGNAPFNHQVQKIYLKLINSVSNLKVALEINNNIIGYFPSQKSYNDMSIKDGYNLSSGIANISLEPFYTSLTSYNTKIHLKADNAINLYGDGTVPYFAEDLNRIIKYNLAYENQLLTITDNTTTITNAENLTIIGGSLSQNGDENILTLPKKQKIDFINVSHIEIISDIIPIIQIWEINQESPLIANIVDGDITYNDGAINIDFSQILTGFLVLII